MRIPQALYAELVEHALLEAPKECCGMIGCNEWGEAVRVYPATNAAESEFRFEIDGTEQWLTVSAMADEGLDLGAIYHSHTRAQAYPSKVDVLTHAYPDALSIIIGVWRGTKLSGEADVRAFRIAEKGYSEVPLTVV